MTQPPVPGGAEAELRAGAVLSRYVVVQRLGAGSGGVVYAAYDTRLSRRVALKVLRGRPSEIAPGRSGGPGWKRLVREAQIIARLDHPHVITVHDVGIEDEHAFIAMELVEGDDLAHWLKDSSASSWRDRARPLLLAAEGLAAAHEAGVVHGDFKPGNVLLGRDGRVRVSDFGIALLREGDDDASTVTDRPDGGVPTTQEWIGDEEPERGGSLWGTPLYAAPELFETVRPGIATDVYSFCASLFEAIYGRPPVEGDTPMAMYSRKLEPVSIPRCPRVPCRLRELLASGLHPTSSHRPSSMRRVVAGLRRALEPVHRRYFVPVLVVSIVGAAGVTWSIGNFAAQPCRGADEHLADVWNPQRASSARTALENTGVPYAEAAWASFESSVGTYADRWIDAHRQVCLATQRGEQSEALLDARMTCLQSRRTELRTLIEAVERADETVATKAGMAAGQLSPVEECLSAGAAYRGDAAISPTLAGRIAAWRGELGRARALDAVDRYEEGLAIAQEVLAQAQGSGVPGVHADALRWVGKLESRLGNYDRGAAAIERAALMAEEHRNDDVAAEAWLDLMWSYMFHREDSARTLGLAPHVEVALHRAEAGPSSWVRFFRARSQARQHAGDIPGASADIEAALTHAAETTDDPAWRLTLITTRGDLYLLRDQIDEAADAYAETLSLARKVSGDSHPDTLGALENLAEARHLQGRAEEARALREEALRRSAEALGENHPGRLSILVNQAVASSDIGRYDDALAAFERAKEGFAESVGTDHPRYAGVLANMAATLGKAGRHAEAARASEEAVARLTKSLGEDHPWVAHSKGNLGASLLRTGDALGAIEPLRDAIALHERLGSGGSELEVLRFDLARALTQSGQPERGEQMARKALAQAQDEALRDHIEQWLAGSTAQ